MTVTLADITADHSHVADPPRIAQNQIMPIRVASCSDVTQHPNASTHNTNVMAENKPNSLTLKRIAELEKELIANE
jgi:hypothetical protein